MTRIRMAVAMIAAAAGAVTMQAAVGSAQAQDADKGKQVFNMCSPCHSIGPDAANKIGPELNGLDGRHSGIVPNFDYSDANKNSGVVWNEASSSLWRSFSITKFIAPCSNRRVITAWAC